MAEPLRIQQIRQFVITANTGSSTEYDIPSKLTSATSKRRDRIGANRHA